MQAIDVASQARPRQVSKLLGLVALFGCVAATGCSSYGGKAYPVTLKAVDSTGGSKPDANLYYLSRVDWDRRAPGDKSLPKNAKPLPSLNGEASVKLPGYQYMAIAEYTGADQQKHWVAQGPFTPESNGPEVKIVVP